MPSALRLLFFADESAEKPNGSFIEPWPKKNFVVEHVHREECEALEVVVSFAQSV